MRGTQASSARIGRTALAIVMAAVIPMAAAGPSFVDITWFSISNMYYEIGPLKIITDGYITRIPASAFFGGRGGLANTHQTYTPDAAGVTKVMNALGGKTSVTLLLTGHSHFDHSFDTATWSSLTGARIIGSHTTCLQVGAQKIPAARCREVAGREVISLSDGVTLRVVRWNHSGSSAQNPEQHDPVELKTAPVVDPVTGGLHAGVAEDFPNGGGNRAYLFTVDTPTGRLSWFFQNSVSLSDLQMPVVVDGVDYGAPLENLKFALKDAGLDSVDLWIGTGGRSVAELLVPLLKPKAYLPVHWDGLYNPFWTGVAQPFRDPPLEEFLTTTGVKLVRPAQYMDKWRLDRDGIRPVDNSQAKKNLGLPG